MFHFKLLAPLCIVLFISAFATQGNAETVGGVGLASWYSEADTLEVRNKHTANGEVFDDERFTCAHPNLPFGTLLYVTNLRNGKSVRVKVNDRGPAKRLVKQGRIIDLAKGAFREIANLKWGLIQVKVEKIK